MCLQQTVLQPVLVSFRMRLPVLLEKLAGHIELNLEPVIAGADRKELRRNSLAYSHLSMVVLIAFV